MATAEGSLSRDELATWLRLSLTPGVGNAIARRLMKAFGLPHRVYEASAASLCSVVSERICESLQKVPADLDLLLETTWSWLESSPLQNRVLPLGDPAYPRALLTMEDPPLLLYAMGAESVWSSDGLNAASAQAIAVVGSRNPTPQGAINARQFSHALAQSGVTIVSGLALGIDGAAHEGALSGSSVDQVATIAVVGTGLDRVYPRQHRDLAHRIAQRGLLISEYALGTAPIAANFPMRNRLIAGLARGTLVVEAALKSGSLITARLTVEQGKDVFAIPGSIHSTQARGCHALIKQGAKLVEGADDILEEMGIALAANGLPTHGYGSGVCHASDGDDELLDALGMEILGLDALLARTGLDTAALQARLMELEILGKVSRLPGGLFQRLIVA